VITDGSEEVVGLFPTTSPSKSSARGTRHGNVYGGGAGPSGPNQVRRHDDCGGSAARFFYSAKADAGDRPHGREAFHPTVKPLDLMRYLVRMVCAPGGVVLDPFAGSGSTGCAALAEGCRFVGIEQSAEYADMAVGRLKLALVGAPPPAVLRTYPGGRGCSSKATPLPPERLP
jgi:site-specific DNA-methyltransferase (adenine-specific)